MAPSDESVHGLQPADTPESLGRLLASAVDDILHSHESRQQASSTRSDKIFLTFFRRNAVLSLSLTLADEVPIEILEKYGKSSDLTRK